MVMLVSTASPLLLQMTSCLAWEKEGRETIHKQTHRFKELRIHKIYLCTLAKRLKLALVTLSSAERRSLICSL